MTGPSAGEGGARVPPQSLRPPPDLKGENSSRRSGCSRRPGALSPVVARRSGGG